MASAGRAAVTAATTTAATTTTTLAGNFGRLWKRGHETFPSDVRRILSVSGEGATHYLQGLVTCDLTGPPIPPREEPEPDGALAEEKEAPAWDPRVPPRGEGVEFSNRLRAACFLDSRGRILTDSLLWRVDDKQYYLDVPGPAADMLLGHLRQFVLRRTKAKVGDAPPSVASHVVFGTLNAADTPDGYLAAVDPRHPSLGMRILSLGGGEDGGGFARMMASQFPPSPGTYSLVRKLAGVAEGRELEGMVAGEANQEFLNAVSFTKGCYLGQELTARVQYTGAIRKRIMPLMMVNPNMQVPTPWLVASQVQAKAKEQARGPDDGNDPETNPRLPRLSPSAVGSIVAMMSGSPIGGGDGGRSQEEDGDTPASAGTDELAAQSGRIFEELQSYKAGDKIYDAKDGKAIGQIVATPAEGTNVLLAQMRLDRVGLMGNHAAWSYTNKVTIGEESSGGSPLRYLPYLPLWWPQIDPDTGKAKP